MDRRINRAIVYAALGALIVLAWTQRRNFTPVDASARAPAYEATTLSGEPFSIEAARGKVVVLNVWATWCTPCVREMPALERLHQELGDEGLLVVGVSTDAGAGTAGPFGQPGGDVRAFVECFKLTFPIVHDATRRIEPLFLVQGLPTTFVIDRQGRIISRAVGEKAWASPESFSYFRKLLQES